MELIAIAILRIMAWLVLIWSILLGIFGVLTTMRISSVYYPGVPSLTLDNMIVEGIAASIAVALGGIVAWSLLVLAAHGMELLQAMHDDMRARQRA